MTQGDTGGVRIGFSISARVANQDVFREPEQLMVQKGMVYGNPCGNPCDPLATSKANVWIIELSCWFNNKPLIHVFHDVFECFYCAVSLGSTNINNFLCFQGAEISFPGNRHPTWCWRSCRLRTLG